MRTPFVRGLGLAAESILGCLLLSACGGGGGSGPDPVHNSDLAVTLKVGAKTVTTNKIRAGDILDVDVPSGEVLEVIAADPVSVASDAGTSTVDRVSEQPLEVKLRFTAPGGATAGLRVSSRKTPADVAQIQVKVSPQRFANRLRVKGEAVTYAVSEALEDGSPLGDRIVKEAVFRVDPDGSYYESPYGDGGTGYNETEHYDADGNLLYWSWFQGDPNSDENDGDSIIYTPKVGLREFPLYVGKTWSTSWLDSYGRANGHATNTVEAYEAVVVPAGIFAALRILSHVTMDGSEDRMCWWSVEKQVDVKCVIHTKNAQRGLDVLERVEHGAPDVERRVTTREATKISP